MSYSPTTIEALSLINLEVLAFVVASILPLAAFGYGWHPWYQGLSKQNNADKKSYLPYLLSPRMYTFFRTGLFMMFVGGFWNYFTGVYEIENGLPSSIGGSDAPSASLFQGTWIVFGLTFLFAGITPLTFFDLFFNTEYGYWVPILMEVITLGLATVTCVLMWITYWLPGFLALFFPAIELFSLYLTIHFFWYADRNVVRTAPLDALLEGPSAKDKTRKTFLDARPFTTGKKENRP